MSTRKYCGNFRCLPEDCAQVAGDAHARHIVQQQCHGIHNQHTGDDAAVGDHLQAGRAGAGRPTGR